MSDKRLGHRGGPSGAPRLRPYYEPSGTYCGPEVGFAEIAVDLLQARYWIVSALPTIRQEKSKSRPMRTEKTFTLSGFAVVLRLRGGR
jgi:hypothetical protein